jgi:hypothetical protein
MTNFWYEGIMFGIRNDDDDGYNWKIYEQTQKITNTQSGH